MSLSGTVDHSAGTACAGLIAWKSGYSCICGQGSTVSTTYSGDPTGLTTLQVGARNGGSDPFFGHISMVEIGRTVLTQTQMSRRLKRSTDLVVIGAGQSLMGGHFHSSDGGSQGGRRRMIEAIQTLRKDDHAVFVNGATSSSAACRTSDNSNYWWDVSASAAGPALVSFHDVVTNTGVGVDAVLWSQGEQDSFYINDETPAADYKAALLAVFNNMRARIGDVPVFIQKIGRRTGAFNNAGGIQAIRVIQQELISEYDWIHLASEVFDQTLYDDIHPSNTGYLAIAGRNGLAAARLFQGSAAANGPAITGAVRTGTSIAAAVSHNGGSDFMPSSGISGFYFMDGNTPIAVTGAVRTNASTITLTLNSTPSSGDETLYYIYDAAASITLGSLVYDNAPIPMPLQSAVISL